MRTDSDMTTESKTERASDMIIRFLASSRRAESD
jgi:hypothetical protein